MDAPLKAYIELAYRYYMEDRLDVAMQVVNDAFQEVGWPAGAWDEFYNELVCEKDARDASTPRQADGVTIELDRTAPERMFHIVSSAAIEARAKIKDALKVEFRRPVTITVFQQDAATEFISGSYGYVMHKHELDKICLPRECVLSYEESLDALAHEFTHVAVYELGGGEVPSWLNEGLAVRMEPDFDARRAPKIDAAISRDPDLLSISHIQASLVSRDLRKDDPSRVDAAYHLAGSIVAWWLDNHGLESLRTALTLIGQGDDDDHAVHRAIGLSRGELEREWRESLKQG